MVLSTSIDGFTAGTPVEALTDDRDSLLAIGMNGEPLPIEHGYPRGWWCRACTASSRPPSGWSTWS